MTLAHVPPAANAVFLFSSKIMSRATRPAPTTDASFSPFLTHMPLHEARYGRVHLALVASSTRMALKSSASTKRTGKSLSIAAINAPKDKIFDRPVRARSPTPLYLPNALSRVSQSDYRTVKIQRVVLVRIHNIPRVDFPSPSSTLYSTSRASTSRGSPLGKGKIGHTSFGVGRIEL